MARSSPNKHDTKKVTVRATFHTLRWVTFVHWLVLTKMNEMSYASRVPPRMR